MPPKADTRSAFLLTHYQLMKKHRRPKNPTTKKAIAAIVFGFFAMLRFHSYGKFTRKNLTIVLKEGGREITPSLYSSRIIQKLLQSNHVLGFYFTFDDKFHPGARAHYCKLEDVDRRLSPICPVKHLSSVLRLTTNMSFFPPKEVTRKILTKNMKEIACLEKFIKPHSLRIGGHTYYTVYGLDSDFRDYLARRKVKGATQTYYRASPALTIFQLRKFYERVFK